MNATLESPGIDRTFGQPHDAAVGKHRRWQRFALALPVLVALVVWGLSLRHVDVSNLGEYGLPPALPLAWYGALALAVIGAMVSIVARWASGPIMVAYILVVAVILFGTVPALSAQPHYAWVYKHIGVVRYIEAHGKVNIKVDIYNRWPGFFALAAVFSQLVGSHDPETYAGWAELVFFLLDTILVMAAVKAVVRETRIAAGAGLFFVVTNWVGQTYYSPQAFAYVLALALLVIVLRQLKVEGASYSRRLTRLAERLGRVPQLSVHTENPTPWPRWATIASVLALDAMIVASHQLTPYMLLVSVFMLMLTGVIRPWWMLGAMALMTFAYFAANFNFIEHNYGVFTSFDPFNNAQGQGATLSRSPAPGKVFNTDVELLLIGISWLASLWGSIRLLRRGLLMRALPLVVLALSPFFVLFGQNYGGEASLRIILFSSPWCAALISWGLATVDSRRLRLVLTMCVAVAFTALFVPSFLGQEELNIISASEVRASEWFYGHARPGSVLVLAAPGFPFRYGATYPEYLGPEGDANPNLLTEPVFDNRQLGAAEVPYIAARIRVYSHYGYIAFGKDETTYGETFHITPPGALANLEAAVAKSPDFRPWYRDDDIRIYELTERQRASSSAAGLDLTKPLPTLPLVKPESPTGKYVFLWRHPQSKGARLRILTSPAKRGSRARTHKRSR